MRLYLSVFSILICLLSCKKEKISDISPPDPSVITVPGSPDLHDFEINLISRTTTSANIAWTNAGDYQSDSVIYTLSLNGQQIAVNINATDYLITNLQPATSYHVEIKASVSGNHFVVSSLDFITDDGYTKFQKSLYSNVAAYDIAIAPQNGYLICLYNAMRNGLLLSRVDSSGNELWRKTYTYNGMSTKIKMVGDGYVIMGGNYILKVDLDGNQVWYKSFEGQIGFVSFTEASNGDFLLAGSDNFISPEIYIQALVIRITAKGDIVWRKSYGQTLRNTAMDIVPADNGGFYVLGSKEFNSEAIIQNSQYWLFKIDNAGNMDWEKTFGDDTYDFPIQLKKINNYLIAGGYTSLDIGGDYQMQIFRLDLNGNVLKQSPVKEPGFYDFLLAVESTNDGGYIVSGTISQGTSGYVLGLFKYDASDNLLWSKSFQYNDDFTYWSKSMAIKQTADNGFILPAAKWQLYGEHTNLWLLKLNPTGSYE